MNSNDVDVMDWEPFVLKSLQEHSDFHWLSANYTLIVAQVNWNDM